MTSNPDPSSTSRSSWAWACLLLALVWAGAVRLPLLLNARAHLDSDLAVDGLTLLDAVNGHWRWHYPATPFIGTPPVLLSWIPARIWGTGPITLVSGGLVAYGLIMVATFLLNRRAFGPSVAIWGLVPLAFASTGTVWLSGRITGGHLMTVAWHAWAFVLLWDALTKGGWKRASLLGLWCGLGLYVDAMFALTWVGLGAAFACHAMSVSGANRIGRAIVCLLAFGLAAGVGVIPRYVGKWVDPHDSYEGQLAPVTDGAIVARNARIMLVDCLPRLIAGHRLPGLQSEPDPSRMPGGSRATRTEAIPWLALSVTVLSLSLFVRAMVALAIDAEPKRIGKEPEAGASVVHSAQVAICWGLLTSSMAMVAGFLLNRTIANSDNYRYLVFLLVPWSTGFGLIMARGSSKRPFGLWVSGSLAVVFAGLMTVDLAGWYDRFGWVDGSCMPIRKAVNDPALAWLEGHPEFTSIYGDYWDVYRLSFLTGGRVRGVPFPQYPDRFPEIKPSLPGEHPRLVIAGPTGFGPQYRARAIAQGGREIGRAEGLSIVEWPVGVAP